MKFKNFLSFLIFAALILSCNSAESKVKQGSLDYHSDLQGEHRLRNVAGAFITGDVEIEYDAPPKGAHDGDSGTNFYIRIRDEKKLVDGKSYEVPNSAFDIMIQLWASPAGSEIIEGEQVKGKITIKEYKPYYHLALDLDLMYQGAKDKWYPIQESVHLKLRSEWIRALKNENEIHWTDWEAKSPLQVKDLVGRWESCESLLFDGKEVKKRVRCLRPKFFEYKEGQFRISTQGDFRELKLTGHEFPYEHGKVYLHSVTKDRLEMTMINQWSKVRSVFKRVK